MPVPVMSSPGSRSRTTACELLALLLMHAPPLDVIHGPRAFSLRTLDELAGRVEWRNRLASYTWIERLLGATT